MHSHGISPLAFLITFYSSTFSFSKDTGEKLLDEPSDDKNSDTLSKVERLVMPIYQLDIL